MVNGLVFPLELGEEFVLGAAAKHLRQEGSAGRERVTGELGRNLEEAGLRNLPGAFLAEIERGGTVLPAVSPRVRLQAGDRLLFVGVVESVVELVRVRGLVPAPDQLFKLDAPRAERRFFEVVVSRSSPMVGRTIREGEFRTRYDAVVIAVARNGARVRGKVGDIEIRTGDTLLLESRPSFITRQRNSRDFLLVSEVRDASLPRYERAWTAIAVLAAGRQAAPPLPPESGTT